jgi:hypothetical protein
MATNNTDTLSRLWTIVSNAIPPIGFFLYFRHRNQYPGKAKRALTSAVTGIPPALIASYVMNTYILN